MLALLVFAGPRALPTAMAASIYYADGGISATIVRPRDCARHDNEFAPGTRFIDDEALPGVAEIRHFLIEHADILARFCRTPGWFLQQFIKLAAVVSSDHDRVFVADGDTIFSTALLDGIMRNPVVLTTGEKFENYDRLLGKLGLSPPRFSCVANGNVFTKAPIIRDLATAKGFKAMLCEHVIASGGRLDFSEYQVMGSLLEPQLGSRRIRMFRRFDLLVGDGARVPLPLVKRALRRYDAVAIEANHHRSLMKRLAAQVLYTVGRSW